MISEVDFNFNLRSNPQMQEFLYEFLGLEPITEPNKKTGNYKTDEATIIHYAEHEKVKFCKLLLQYRKLNKALNTYIADLKRNVSEHDGKVHHELWLNVAETYRSSSSDPNLQNQPKHGDILPNLPWKTIRKVFICLGKGWLITEFDYDGAEVKVAGMLGNDPQMIEDLNNDLDMHSHWAIKLFGLKGYSYEQVKEKFGDNERFLAKNNFTFANFFGAGFSSIAEEMRKSDFYKDFVNNIYNQRKAKHEAFDHYFFNFSENHIKDCQNQFYERYHIYKIYQDAIVDKYYKTGYVENPFGFRRRFPLTRNEIINYPIQSTSFLLLLDSLINIEDELEKGEWQSHLINQIHDSGKANLKTYEAGDFMDMVDNKMTDKPHLPWSNTVKMGVDWEVGKNWLDMKRIKRN
jgi:DNA polymerase I-like protein with 3'-5' exonuclease and polymerase domains